MNSAAATRTLIQKIGNSVRDVARNKSSSWWYTPHMAAASRAIADRIPLVDLILEVRDARIPLSSKFHNSKDLSSSSRHIIVLNKVDLTNRSLIKEWATYFAKQNSKSFGVNAHNKDSVKELLNFLQARAREMIKANNCGQTATIMLVGIPNVGKSALANSLHQIGRISAAEKGKLKHAILSPHPGETKNITSLKIASHPNIYVLDTPGILPPEIFSEEVCSKLALIGAIQDFITGKTILAQYFLAILNQSDEYKKWEKFLSTANTIPDDIELLDVNQRKKQQLSDHTQINAMLRDLPEDKFGPQIRFREYSLFENPSMPQKVKESWLDVRLCEQGSEDCQVSDSTSSNGLLKFPNHSNDETYRSVFSAFKDVKVIQFLSMQDAFSGFIDQAQEEKFRKRMKHYISDWCCLEHTRYGGHIPFDIYWDKKDDWKPKLV